MLKRLIKLSLLIAALAIPCSASLAYTHHSVPENNGVKNYMDYRAITNTASRQYELQQRADTTALGIREVEGRYCVAIGTGFGLDVGANIDVYLSTGETLPCIVADIKRDCDTDWTNKRCTNGNVIEFVISTPEVNSYSRARGDMSTVDILEGSVVSLYSYDEGEIPTNEVEDRYIVSAKYEMEQADGSIIYTLAVKTPVGDQSVVVTADEYAEAEINYTTISLN